MGTVRHLYVHVPFCRTRCAYCDFASEPLGAHQRAGRVARFLEAIAAELAANEHLLAPRLSTVYLGGGTPTALPRQDLLGLVVRLARRLAPGGEFTVEANPGDLDQSLVRELSRAGCTRLSLGVQSFSPELRAALGRRCRQPEVEAALTSRTATARTLGLEWNLDLVIGIPGQDARLLGEDLSRVLALGPPHVSLYDLTYTAGYEAFLERRAAGPAPGSVSASAAASGGAALSGPPEAASLGGAAAPRPPAGPPAGRAAAKEFAEEWYGQAVDRLASAGYRRYEVSNFARPGHESRHNLAYWRGEDYLGLGPSAVSTVGPLRRSNPVSVAGYLSGEAPQIEVLNPEVKAFERVMLGLRTAEGVPVRQAEPVIDPAAWERARVGGLAGRRCGTLFLTQRGLDLSSAVLAEVLVFPDPRVSPAGV